MIRKLLCWLGWHEWKSLCAICWNGSTDYCEQDCNKCPNEIICCKHCGKVKK